MGYLKSVDRALEQSKDQVRLSKGALGPYEQSLPQIILPDERLAMDGLSLSPELLSCQVLKIQLTNLWLVNNNPSALYFLNSYFVIVEARAYRPGAIGRTFSQTD